MDASVYSGMKIHGAPDWYIVYWGLVYPHANGCICHARSRRGGAAMEDGIRHGGGKWKMESATVEENGRWKMENGK